MAKVLTRAERKKRLTRGMVKSIATRTRRTSGHVSQVISGLRRDAVVERETARRFKMAPRDVFPAEN